MKTPIPGQRHHWFPKSLAKAAWIDADGMVSRTNSRGRTKRWHPGGIGYAIDNHNILWDGGGPWEHTFEPDFDSADNAFPEVVRWLEGEVHGRHAEGARSHGVPVTKAVREPLAECLASLIVRSPRLRYLSEKHTAELQGRFGLRDPHNVRQTAGLSLARLQRPFARDIRTGGKFGFLIANEGSFLFGDGLMSNHNPVPDRSLHPMAMVALTPDVAVLWFSPRSYASHPSGVSLRLSGEEVSSFNEIVQVYSCDNLFHKGEAPELHEAFKLGQHLIVHTNHANHRTPSVDQWMAEILEVWEPG